MSDNWITLVPENPRFVPDAAKQRQARERFAEIAPEADDVDIKVSEKVMFFDCGGNLERVRCPSCGSVIPVEWWHERMDEDHDDGFKLAAYATPCCRKKATLNELVYEWPQAFGRFALDAMNPNVGTLDDEDKQEIERILGTKLRVIYQRV